jgi:mannose-6-phosphate isomerase-like protein (cupin superfamily)
MGSDPVERRGEREQFQTKDGSLVTELIHPHNSDARRQSIAEAIVPAGGATIEHLHRESEEIYVFTDGAGEMRMGERAFPVAAGDSVVIAPGTSHKLVNPGPEPLVLLCVSAPAYSHEDTVLLEQEPPEAGGAAQ